MTDASAGMSLTLRTAVSLVSLAVVALSTCWGGVAPAAGTPQPSGTVVPLISAPSAPSAPSAQSALSAQTAVAAPRDSRQPLVVDPGVEFNLVGALVRGVSPARRGVTVRLRTSLDGVTWTDWLALEFPTSRNPEGSAIDPRDTASEPAWIGRARYVQVESAGESAAVSAVQASLRVVCVTSPWEEAAAGEPGAAPSGEQTEAAAADEETNAAAADEETNAAAADEETNAAAADEASLSDRSATKPTIVTRQQWGANESWRNDGPFYGRVKMVFIHHTVSSNSYTREQSPAIVRSIYYYHANVLGWNDIGYNFLVDRYGRVFEGRYGGMTRSVIGAQTLGFNTNSFGVSMIGTYTSAAPPAAAVTALERLIAWKLDVHHVDPLGYARVRCLDGEKFPKGALVRFNVISGHRQANYTTCPGNGIFNSIGTIRRTADAIGNPKIFAPAASPSVFSPNGDGERDVSKAVCALSQSADWKVEVRNDMGAVVRTLSGRGETVSAEWDGRNAGGEALPDGRYVYVMSAGNDNGSARNAQIGVRIDSGAPPVQNVHASPALVSPNGDGRADSARVAFTLVERGRVRISLFDADGGLVRRLRDWTAASAGTRTCSWDGTITVDGRRVAAPDGDYRVRVEAMDNGGNRGTGACGLTVNSTLGFVAAAPLYISPNGDGVQDSSRLTFKLARSARVTVSLVSGAEVLRKWALGDLAKGTHSTSWDGADSGGSTVASGSYAFVTTATNAVGTVSVRATVRVDRTRPRPATTVTAATARVGRAFVLKYSVVDKYSPSVRVRIVVTSAAGTTVKSALVGWVTSGRSRSWSYTPTARGTYAVAVTATDRAGNRQSAAAKVALTVR